MFRPDSPRDFGAIQIIYLLTYLLTYDTGHFHFLLCRQKQTEDVLQSQLVHTVCTKAKKIMPT